MIDQIKNLEGQLNDLNAKLNQCNIDGKNKAEQIQYLKNANDYLDSELKRTLSRNEDLLHYAVFKFNSGHTNTIKYDIHFNIHLDTVIYIDTYINISINMLCKYVVIKYI